MPIRVVWEFVPPVGLRADIKLSGARGNLQLALKEELNSTVSSTRSAQE
jgi:hypothetical protein